MAPGAWAIEGRTTANNRSFTPASMADAEPGPEVLPRRFVGQAWGGPYTEGSAWQQSFAVYHNLADLVATWRGCCLLPATAGLG